MHKQLPFHLLHSSAKRQTTVFVNRKIPWVSPVWHRFWMPFMSVVHTLKERDAVLNHQKGAAPAQSLSRVHRASSVVQSWRCPTTWISNNNQTDEYVQSFAVSDDFIISKRLCRKPWPNRKVPRECEAVFQSLQLRRGKHREEVKQV